MSFFQKLFRKNASETDKNNMEEKKQKFISSYRYHGRWYGLMLCLGEESGRDMQEKLKDKASEVLTMLQISNEFPDDFKYVNQLLALEKATEAQSTHLTDDEQQSDYLLGILEAKKVYLDGKDWDRLLKDEIIPKETESSIERKKAQEERKNFSEANFAVGQQFLKEKQYERAFQTFKLIAENDDHQDAQFNLAIMYHRGMGTEKNIHEAIRWYETVAKHNDNQAMYNLGLIYYYGDDGLLPDHEKAVQWMRLAAENGNEKAKAYLFQGITDAFLKAAKDNAISPTWDDQKQAYVFKASVDSLSIDEGNCILGIFKVMSQTFLQMYLPFPEITEDKKSEFEKLLSDFNKQMHIQLKMDQYNKIYALILLDTERLLQSASIAEDLSQILHMAISEVRLVCKAGLF